MTKNTRGLIQLKSTANTGFFYTTNKNKTNTKHKLTIKKYDPKLRKHIAFIENPIK